MSVPPGICIANRARAVWSFHMRKNPMEQDNAKESSPESASSLDVSDGVSSATAFSPIVPKRKLKAAVADTSSISDASAGALSRRRSLSQKYAGDEEPVSPILMEPQCSAPPICPREHTEVCTFYEIPREATVLHTDKSTTIGPAQPSQGFAQALEPVTRARKGIPLRFVLPVIMCAVVCLASGLTSHFTARRLSDAIAPLTASVRGLVLTTLASEIHHRWSDLHNLVMLHHRRWDMHNHPMDPVGDAQVCS